MAEQHPELNRNEEPHLLPSKRKGSPHEADAEASTKKRDVDPNRKSIMEHYIDKGIFKVDKDTQMVTVKIGKGLLEADIDKGTVKIGIGKEIMKFTLNEGNVIKEEAIEEKPIEEEDPWEAASLADFDVNDGVICARFKPYRFNC